MVWAPMTSVTYGCLSAGHQGGRVPFVRHPAPPHPRAAYKDAFNGTAADAEACVCTDSAAKYGACTNYHKKRHKVEANDGL